MKIFRCFLFSMAGSKNMDVAGEMENKSSTASRFIHKLINKTTESGPMMSKEQF